MSSRADALPTRRARATQLPPALPLPPLRHACQEFPGRLTARVFCPSWPIFFSLQPPPAQSHHALRSNSPHTSRTPRTPGLANTVMSADHPIGAPFTLATLSKPVGASCGRVHAAGVCSISGIKKRKRTEIAVGLDGEGISIYSVSLLCTRYLRPKLTFPPSCKTHNSSRHMLFPRAPPSLPPHTPSTERAPPRALHAASRMRPWLA